MAHARRHDAIVFAILAAVPTLLFLDVLLGINGFYVRDVLHYYYPAKKVLREIILSGHFPYWNPWFSSGQPLAANPEHEVFYPLNWLILVPDYVRAFQLLPLLHLYIATFTMYALLRSMQLGRPAACIGAISFGVGGLLCSMLILFPYLFSIAWLPLTCLYTRRFLLHRSPRDFALAAFFFGVQLIVGEPTTAFQSGLLLAMYALYRRMKDGDARMAARRVVDVAAIAAVAVCVAAVQVIPTVDHLRDSARGRGIDFVNVARWSTPFQRLPELVYPTFLGRHAALDHTRYWATALYGADTKVPFYFSIYSGLLLAVMAAAGLLIRARGSGLAFAIIVISVVVAAGVNTPLLRLLYDAGVAASLRYPEKFVLMLVFTIIVFGAQSLDRLLGGDESQRKMALAITVGITLVAAAAALLSMTDTYEPLFRRVWSIPSTRALGEMIPLSRLGWITAAARGAVLLLLLAALQRIRRPLWITLAGVFALVDLGTLVPELAPRLPLAFYRDVPQAATRFPPQREAFRIFHIANWSGNSDSAAFYLQPRPELYWILRNRLAPMTPAAYDLRMAVPGDFNATELIATDDFTKATWRLAKKRPDTWVNVVASMSNVWYVGIYRRPDDALARARGVLRDLEPVRFIEGPHFPRYSFARTMSIARNVDEFVDQVTRRGFERDIAFVSEGSFQPAHGVVHGVDEWPNGARIAVEADGKAFLVMSVTPHKYWRITIDGIEVDAIVTNLGYQGVVVPQGRHTVEMRYRNPLVIAGGAISLAALVALAWAFCTMRGL